MSGKVYCFDTKAEMTAATVADNGSRAYVIEEGTWYTKLADGWGNPIHDRDYVSPKDFGAKGDGQTDDTAAFLAALSAGDCVVIPEGEYVLSQPLTIGQYKSLSGRGNASVLICKSADGLLRLSADTTLKDLCIRVPNGSNLSGSLIEVSDRSLSGAILPRTANVNVQISSLDIFWDSANADAYKHCSNIDILCNNSFPAYEAVDRSNTKNCTGFYGVTIKDVRVNAHFDPNVGYFVRSYTKNNCWITGCSIENCNVYGCRWSFFMHDSDDNFANVSSTISPGAFTVRRCQHQCSKNSKGFAFVRGSIQFEQCIPWDWHVTRLAPSENETEYTRYVNHPYCVPAGTIFRDSIDNAKIAISPAPGATQIAEVNADGSLKVATNSDLYYLSTNFGTSFRPIDLQPKQLMTWAGRVNPETGTNERVRAICLYKYKYSSPSRLTTGIDIRVHFRYHDYDGATKTVKLNLKGAAKTLDADGNEAGDTFAQNSSYESDLPLSVYSKFGYTFDRTLYQETLDADLKLAHAPVALIEEVLRTVDGTTVSVDLDGVSVDADGTVTGLLEGDTVLYKAGEITAVNVYLYTNATSGFIHQFTYNEPMSNVATTYSGIASNSNHDHTINTFSLPVEKRYLLKVPGDLKTIATAKTWIGAATPDVLYSFAKSNGYIGTKAQFAQAFVAGLQQ